MYLSFQLDEKYYRRIMIQDIKATVYPKNSKAKSDEGMAQVVEFLCGKNKSLSTAPSPPNRYRVTHNVILCLSPIQDPIIVGAGSHPKDPSRQPHHHSSYGYNTLRCGRIFFPPTYAHEGTRSLDNF
jgi:hypothetical protein